MSLQVWLPLTTSTIKNQGLSNVTVTNNGATYSSSGKLGGSWYFNGSSYIRITLPSSMTTILGCTVAAWVYSSSSVVALGGISQDLSNYSAPCVTLYTSGWQFTSTARSGYGYVSGGTIANTSTWHHVCCTVGTDGAITTYLDGSQVTTSSLSTLNVSANTSLTSSNFIEIGCDHPGGDEYLTGYVNDFRIYDHALSAMEVKHLAQGLVLHYPLSRGGFGQDNLLLGTAMATSTTSYLCKQLTLSENLEAGETYTLQYWDVEISNSGGTATSDGLATYWGGGSVSLVGNTVPDSDGYICKTFTVTSSQASGSGATNLWLNVYNTTPSSGRTSRSATIGRWKLEKGSTATPWTPNSSDSLYTSMGLDGTTEYDCSGYCNNGTKTGTFTWTSDTPKYSVSTKFPNNCNTWIANSDFLQLTKNLTFACWCKLTTGSNSTYSYIVSQGRDNTASGFNLVVINGKLCVQGSFGTVNSNVNIDNTWQHVVGTYDGTAVKIYINGELKNSLAYTSDLTYTYAPALVIGKMAYSYTNTGSYFPCNGNISDVRIYATALSASDVLSLYQNSAYVDSSGTIYGQIR